MEKWLPVPGFEGFYEVSSQGQVRSLDRVIQRRDRGRRPNVGAARFKGRMLARKFDSGGYPLVTLYRDAKGHSRNVHRLVCEAFHGPCPTGHEAAHRNGLKPDCRADNLVWATPIENAAHKLLHAQGRAA